MSAADRALAERSRVPGSLAERLTSADLYQALRRKAAANRTLGDLLSGMGVVDKADLDAVLALQQAGERGPQRALVDFVGRKLGYILLRSAMVTEADLESAIREHELTGRKLGEVLVGRGAITKAQLAGALRMQKQSPEAEPARLRLGQMLVDAGVISRATLEEGVASQRVSGKLLGETLVESGAISEAVLRSFLARQRGAIAAAATAIALMSWSGFHSPDAESASAAREPVHSSVMQLASITSNRSPVKVEITAADIARGYVEIGPPVEFDLHSENPAGLILAFSLNSAAVTSASLQSPTDTLHVGDEGASFRVPQSSNGARTQTISLRVRLNLAPGNRPGSMDWPLAVFVAPA